ncbi:hypothetical protein L228DRAFT_241156 [Xylona heveae TC161]|uniref:Uncharacterized protein n=1 Tax=Xylona heveae (strain CBS 132557 / TC161) TaxID=1328760 RepID=A0A165A4T3_XYLHT|nr:hypothetical protein L228DRAFT_241156 [Xylona heveae TC161]KZF19949.1 hypothetical protein L228DRAFT_241156 [Xylona heveae TC161]
MLAVHVPQAQAMATELHDNTRPKRPRLSLQIASAITPQNFIRPANGGTLCDDMSSPTVRNTFNNSSRNFLSHPSKPPSEAWTIAPNCTSSSNPLALPYSLPRGLPGILRNTVLQPRQRSATLVRAPRQMFPPVKSVSFKNPLVEEITTSVYVAAHSDLDSLESDNDDEGMDSKVGNYGDDSTEGGKQKQISWAPVRRKGKRHRQWTWTLDTLDDGDGDATIKYQRVSSFEGESSKISAALEG